MSKNKEVATKNNTDVALAMDFHADAGAGYEEADKDAFAIPFISILQALSPQVDASEGEYIEGAIAGMFVNTVTADIFKGTDGIEVIPVHYNRTFTEWGLRESGGGFKGEHPKDTELKTQTTRDEKSREILPNGNQLVDSRNHYVLMKNEAGSWNPVMLSFTSTQIKKSKKWMTSMNQIQLDNGNGRMYNPPMFAHIYRMTTVKEKNEKGSWFGFKLERVGFVEDENAFAKAKEFREQILSGEAKAAHESSEGGIPGFGDDDTGM